MEKPNIDKKIRSGKANVDKYIESLENYLLSINNSSIYKLIQACDENASVIADDVMLLATELDDEVLESRLQMLGSKKNKRFESFLALMGKMKDFKVLNDILNELKPNTVSNEVVKESSVPVKKKSNIQDFVFNGE